MNASFERGAGGCFRSSGDLLPSSVFAEDNNCSSSSSSLDNITSGILNSVNQEGLAGHGERYAESFSLRQPIHMIVIYSIAYMGVFCLGVLGNTLVVWVVYRNPRMHDVTHYFIVSLAAADLLVCILLPITFLTNLYAGWIFGAAMCKVTPFLQGISVSASVNTLMAIAIDRYLAICHSFKYFLTTKVARIIITSIWLFAVTVMTPWAVSYRQEATPTEHDQPPQPPFICIQRWPSESVERIYFLAVIFVTCYTIPLVCISACYALIGCRVCNRHAPGVVSITTSAVVNKSKVKVLKMLLVVIVLFAFSWLPLYVVQLRLLFGPPLETESSEFAWLTQVIIPVNQWCGSANSCVNPIIYCFFSKKFRTGFKDCMVGCCGRRRASNAWDSRLRSHSITCSTRVRDECVTLQQPGVSDMRTTDTDEYVNDITECTQL